MNSINIKAPAKINIGLFVISKRKDGFHNIYTLFYPINDLYDELSFTKSEMFIFSSNAKDLTEDDSNLIIKAKSIIEKYVKQKINVAINLKKRIPIGGGLGGGSSDAAATLISLNKLYKLNLTKEVLLSMALKLGSDVPFFLNKKSAVGSSRGEVLQEIPLKIDKPILIVNPGISISTKEAFANVVPSPVQFDYFDLVKNNSIDYQKMNEFLHNVFEDYIFANYKEIGEIKKKMYSAGALFSLMTGTGSTVYGIFNNINEAENAYNSFPKNYFRFISCPY
ncbi:4-(cytidine 5'-diphospho)-2-C-methyl-D-erythritol kinase [Melioribacteraceae bacterium 4301-Me]|uniref:4-(cytidine 5'-diphospho)-2-C-methyl-D-erythritol kinase n=1 Tax=Pyranulibacter aquaticus TaxID=3163344 RepID=UPI00359976FC